MGHLVPAWLFILQEDKDIDFRPHEAEAGSWQG
jgi:hypothetical protein